MYIYDYRKQIFITYRKPAINRFLYVNLFQNMELLLFEMKTSRFQKLFKKIFVHCVIPNLSCGFLQYYSTDSTFFAWFKVCCSKNTVENIHAHTSDREQKIGFYRHGEVVSLTLIISAKFSNYTASKWQFSFFFPFFSFCKEELDRRRELVGVIGRPHKIQIDLLLRSF